MSEHRELVILREESKKKDSEIKRLEMEIEDLKTTVVKPQLSMTFYIEIWTDYKQFRQIWHAKALGYEGKGSTIKGALDDWSENIVEQALNAYESKMVELHATSQTLDPDTK